jgi:glucose/arabinose dehydrogenase
MRARAAALVLAVGLLWVAASAPAASGVTLPSGFQDEPVITGLEEPTNFRFAPDGRIFVAEKPGLILVFDGLDDETPEVFADLRTKVYDTGDRGILGLALDPDFPTRPYVYVLYTYDHILGEAAPPPRWGTPDTTGDPCPEPKGADACLVSGRLVRLEASGDHAIEENGAPLEDVLVEDWCQQFSSHSIGDLQFGPEGALYASAGDGASFSHTDFGQLGEPPNACGDPPKEGGAMRAQDVRTGPTEADPLGLDGTIIRIDPDTGEGLPGNPMYSSPDRNARRIVGYGFRNPFRFSIDPDTHEIYVGNVGWDTWEEIDRFNPTSGQAFNSGWPCYEGPAIQPAYQFARLPICENLYANPGAASMPFFYYHHQEGLTPEDTCPTANRGQSIAGSAFYEEGPFPSSYDGAFFFSDATRQCIYTMFPGEDGRPDPSTVTLFMKGTDPYSGVDVEIGPDHDLYYAALFSGGSFGPGAIHRIRYFSGNQPPVARLSADHEWGVSPLTVQLDASGSSDADGDQLTYEWDLNGDGVFNDAPTNEETVTETYEGSANHTAAVRVVDPSGASSIARVTLYPNDSPPDPVIESPEPDFEWTIGEPIDFEGSAHDAEDGNLPPTSLDWNTRLLHCPGGSNGCHAHPLQAFPTVGSGSFLAPDHEYPSHIELTLTAIDSRGLTAKQTLLLDPRAVELSIDSNPPGVELGAGVVAGQPAPIDLTVISGAQVALSAPASVTIDGREYFWRSWSDGGSREHTVLADTSQTITALFTPEQHQLTITPAGNGSGSVSSDPAGIDCGSTCSASFDHGTEVLLSGTPDPGSEAVLWSGCDQVTGGGECEVEIDAARAVTATFTLEKHELTITPAGDGSGSVSSDPAGIDCGSTCSASFDHGTEVLLSGTPDPGSEAILWSGCDQVTGGDECEVEIDAARAVTATFTLEKHELPTPEIPRPPIPAATISTHPAKQTKSSVAHFTFFSSQAGNGFLCRLDSGPLKACRSPRTFRHLKPRRHSFIVIPVAPDGSAGDLARFSWRVKPKG